jgi:hypothetical protein
MKIESLIENSKKLNRLNRKLALKLFWKKTGSAVVTILIIIVVTLGIMGWNSPTKMDLPEGGGTLICGVGFFYDDAQEKLNSDMGNQLFYKMEELAKKCPSDEQEPRTECSIKKASVLIRGEVCVVNWGLPAGLHLQAYRKTCLDRNGEYM